MELEPWKIYTLIAIISPVAIIVLILIVTWLEDTSGKHAKVSPPNTVTDPKPTLESLKPTYNIPLTRESVAANAGELYRWEQDESKWHCVLISNKLNNGWVDVSALHQCNTDNTFVNVNGVAAFISIKPLSLGWFSGAQVTICSPVSGVVSFYESAQYQIRGVIASVETDKAIVSKWEELNHLSNESIEIEQTDVVTAIAVLGPEETSNREEQYKLVLAREKQEREQAEKDEIGRRIKEKHRKRQLYKEVEARLIEDGEILKGTHRPIIPQDVRDAVYTRDGGRCLMCDSTTDLQFDHIIPYSKGGATSVENLQVLCLKCNLAKSNHIG